MQLGVHDQNVWREPFDTLRATLQAINQGRHKHLWSVNLQAVLPSSCQGCCFVHLRMLLLYRNIYAVYERCDVDNHRS